MQLSLVLGLHFKSQDLGCSFWNHLRPASSTPEQLEHRLRVASSPCGTQVADSAEDAARVRRAAVSSRSDRCGQSGD